MSTLILIYDTAPFSFYHLTERDLISDHFPTEFPFPTVTLESTNFLFSFIQYRFPGSLATNFSLNFDYVDEDPKPSFTLMLISLPQRRVLLSVCRTRFTFASVMLIESANFENSLLFRESYTSRKTIAWVLMKKKKLFNSLNHIMRTVFAKKIDKRPGVSSRNVYLYPISLRISPSTQRRLPFSHRTKPPGAVRSDVHAFVIYVRTYSSTTKHPSFHDVSYIVYGISKDEDCERSKLRG